MSGLTGGGSNSDAGGSFTSASSASAAATPSHRRCRSGSGNDWLTARRRPPSAHAEFRRRSSSGRMPASPSPASRRGHNHNHPSIADIFQIVTKDFFRQYSCDGGAAVEAALSGGDVVKKQQPFSTMLNLPMMPSPRRMNRSATESTAEEGEAGIEFNEEEILRRDYELNRV